MLDTKSNRYAFCSTLDFFISYCWYSKTMFSYIYSSNLQIVEVVCCKLTPLQTELYKHFIQSKNVRFCLGIITICFSYSGLKLNIWTHTFFFFFGILIEGETSNCWRRETDKNSGLYNRPEEALQSSKGKTLLQELKHYWVSLVHICNNLGVLYNVMWYLNKTKCFLMHIFYIEADLRYDEKWEPGDSRVWGLHALFPSRNVLRKVFFLFMLWLLVYFVLSGNFDSFIY